MSLYRVLAGTLAILLTAMLGGPVVLAQEDAGTAGNQRCAAHLALVLPELLHVKSHDVAVPLQAGVHVSHGHHGRYVAQSERRRTVLVPAVRRFGFGAHCVLLLME